MPLSLVLPYWLLISFLVTQVTQEVTTLPSGIKIPALIVFGDSIMDPGNNNYYPTIAKCNFPPYGKNFMGGKPTGRFSNGKIPTDLIAEELGIKELLPAYLDPSLNPADLITGVSFATGAAGYDPLTSQIAGVISLSDQLDLFKEYIQKLKVAFGQEKTESVIKDSIYLVVAGSDDIANTYFPIQRLEYTVSDYTDLMIKGASTFIQDLHKLGARRIGVFSAPPIGCVPSQRTLWGGLKRQCAEEQNQAATLFNSKLSSTLDKLNTNFDNAKAIYIDIYHPLLGFINNPTKFGFEVVDQGCCGTGNIEVSILCNKLTPITCQNVSKYLFWDSYHPTEQGYIALTKLIVPKYKKYLFCMGNQC